MNRTSAVRFRYAAAMTLGLTAGGVFARPAQGDVVFAPAELYPVGNTPIAVTVADVNSDGALDVISANGDLSLLINNGDGTLATEVRLGVGGGGPPNVAVGDLDGDGDADIVASIQNGPGTIAVFLAEPAGVFAPAVQYGTTNHSFALVMDDLDGDDDPDVAVVRFGGLGVAVSVFRNAGDGTFLPAEAYNAFEADIVYTAELAAGDVDGDGWTDLVVVNDCPVGCDAVVAILINAGDGTFLAPSPVDLGLAGAGSVRVDDLDGDGDGDVAIGCASPGGDLLIAVNDGAGAFSVLSRSPTGRFCSVGSVTAPDGIALFDVDGDGAPDAVLPSRINDEVRVLRNRGDLTFEPSVAFACGERPIAVAAGDLDGDGRADVVTADRSFSTPTVTVLINQTPTGNSCTADLNGDGQSDLADFAFFADCMSGPGQPVAPSCESADLENDDDLDMADFAMFQAAFGCQ